MYTSYHRHQQKSVHTLPATSDKGKMQPDFGQIAISAGIQYYINISLVIFNRLFFQLSFPCTFLTILNKFKCKTLTLFNSHIISLSVIGQRSQVKGHGPMLKIVFGHQHLFAIYLDLRSGSRSKVKCLARSGQYQGLCLPSAARAITLKQSGIIISPGNLSVCL